jgi:hypothetical protein
MGISSDRESGDAVGASAAESGQPLAFFLAEAPASKAQAEALARFLEDWQAEHGALTPAEIAKAEQELSLRPGSPPG